MERIVNAKIEKVSISMADHGCLTFELFLNGYYWGVAFGGYCIGHGFLGADDFSANSGAGLVAMMRIMDTIGVDKWEDLEGKYCRVKDNGNSQPIYEIGNVITDKWFNIKEFFANYKQEDNNEFNRKL